MDNYLYLFIGNNLAMKISEELINNLIKLFNQYGYPGNVSRYLDREGINRQFHEDIIREVEYQYAQRNAKTRRIIWIISTLTTFIVFYYLIPIKIYNLASILFSFLGSVLFIFFVIQSIANFRKYEFNPGRGNRKADWRFKILPLFSIPFLAMAFIFQMHFYSNEEIELNRFGEKTYGVLVGGHASTYKRSTIYQVEVKFKTIDGQTIIKKEIVGEGEYAKSYRGKKVLLTYSKRNPKVFNIKFDTELNGK
jgi:hypothetical protein